MSLYDKINKLSIPDNVTFLVLEDTESVMVQLVSDLRKIGIKGKIIETVDVKSALIACSKNNIDFIISDWNLPDGTGLEFLKKVRASKRFQETPFIMCTTKNEVKHMLDAVEAGANDYVVKPWDFESLKSKIQLTYKQHQDRS